MPNRARQSDRERAREDDRVPAQGVDTAAARIDSFLGEQGNDSRTNRAAPLGGREEAVTGADLSENGLRNPGLGSC